MPPPLLPLIRETTVIEDNNGNPISLGSKLDCQSKHIIYVIECENCKIRYVGETSQKLKDRMNQHRSDINCKQDTVIADHFSLTCPNVNFLRVIPVEQVNRLVPESYTFMGMLEKCDELQLLQREQFWIKRLKTLAPNGLNLRQELPPPTPLSLLYMYTDQSHEIVQIAKAIYKKIQERNGHIFFKLRMVAAYKRNRNLQDILVTARLK